MNDKTDKGETRRGAVALAALVGALALSLGAARPEIGVVYFPDYHPNDAWNVATHGGAWSEWNLVRAGVPRWKGHKQPFKPLWGYTDESDPKVMERAIDAMADHGVDFVMYDWYWYDGGPFLENALNRGFLKARNRNRLKFFIMWANHDWGNYPVHRRGATMLRFWKPTEAQFEKAVRHVIADYFSQPNYMKTAAGEPIFSIYDIWGFASAFGGFKGCREHLDLMRRWTKEAGYPGLHVNVHSCGVYDAEKMSLNLDEAWGYDSVTTYTLTHHMRWTGRETDYNTASDDYMNRIWPDLAKKLKVPYYPTATVGWDSTARGTVTEPWGFGPYPWTGIITGSTPANFRRALARLKADAEKNRADMILVNSWNEWTEGSVLEPQEETRFGYLEAIRDVFGVKPAGLATGRFTHEMPKATNERPTNPARDGLARDFRDPFGKVRTGAYWYWISGNVSCEGIVRDLEAMKRAGIDRVHIGDVNICAVADRKTPLVKTLSSEWQKALVTAFAKASELGIEVGVFNSPGWSQSGGPWVSPDQATRRYACGATRVTGPRPGPLALPLPDLGGMPANEARDAAVVAFPSPAREAETLAAKGPLKADRTGVFTTVVTSAVPFAAQSVRLVPDRSGFSGEVTVEALSNGAFVACASFRFARANDMRGVGFLPLAPIVGTFAPVAATRFRVTVRGKGPASFASVELAAAPQVAAAYEKTLAKMHETPFPTWSSYQWPRQAAERAGSAYDPSRAVNLTDRLKPDGSLDWNVPDGAWTVFRLVMVPTGAKNTPANPEATGYETDKMSRRHIAHHVESYLGKILDRTPPAARAAVRYAVMDSHETGGQNATDDFAPRFRAAFGYDPTPYLPVVSGAAVGSRDASDRFLWDLRRFVADELAYSYAGGLRAASARRGLSTWLENYGHWGFPGEFLQFGGQSDEIAGEFWSDGDLGRIENRAASSCAHTYGKRLVWSESNTCGGLQFSRGPMDLKTRTDLFFTEGINATLLHLYVHQPDEREPGLIAPWGNEFNRKNSWFDHLDLFTGYLKRCNLLLRQGLYVADLAYFIGEDAPVMTGLADPPPPPGRQFDFINAEVLVETAGVDAAGRIVLPHGTAYEVLVLPPLRTMRPKTLAKIARLVEAGATVVGPRPERSPSLADQPRADETVRALAARLWGDVDGAAVTSAPRGRGTIAWNAPLEALLAARKSAPDVLAPAGVRLNHAHRTFPNGDIYFLATPDGAPLGPTEISLRAGGRVPEIWDAATGEIRPATAWRHEAAGHTAVTLALAPRESAFVVFWDGAKGTAAGRAARRADAAAVDVTGPWEVAFQSDAVHRGPVKPIRLERLADLRDIADPAVRNYSGRITYRTRFTCAKPAEARRLTLALGDVAVTAKVRLNGRDAGGVCFAPYALDVTPFVRDGANDLEIEVCTLWLNRLIADEGRADRPTWVSLPMALKGVKPVPAGLKGPVRLLSETVETDAAGEWTLASDGARARFAASTGALVSLTGADGAERVEPAAEMFTLSLLDAAGRETRLKSSDFTFARRGATLAYRRAGGPEVEIAVRAAPGGAFAFRPRVANVPRGLRLNWIDAPHVNVSTAGRLYWPYLDGCEVTDYTTRTNRASWCFYEPVTWVPRCRTPGALYPGNAQMQFLAHYRDGRGLYFAAEDPRHAQKGVEWEYLSPKAARLSLQTFCGEAKGGAYDGGFDYVLRPYAGDWREGCALHRDWIASLDAFKTPTAQPDWMRDSPVTLIYPVKGEGMDNTVGMGPNRYYPYENVLPDVARYKKLLDSKVMALLMHWEGTAPWCPPYVWPPYGGEAALARLRDALHAQGDLLGLYCSGTAWTQVSCVDPRYTQTAKFVDEDLGRFMMRGPRGEIDATVCNHTRAQRFGYDLCLTEPWSRRTLIDELMKLARFGVDYCQFFDQNLGGGPNLCWSARHAHAAVPGAWATEAMLSLQNEMVDAVRKAGSKMTIGCEGAAAAPFVRNLFFNDARAFFTRDFGRAVPGLAYVFHEWMCNFSGNQVAVRTDEAFRWAYSFHCGDMLSLILGPEGKLVTAWAVPWREPLPDQERLLGLVRTLNALRRKYPGFLQRGRMTRPPFRVEVGSAKVRGDAKGHAYDEVLWSYWRDASGREKGFATNWQNHPAKIRLGERTKTLAPLETVEF